MSILRWLPTFLAFPIGGLLAISLLGSADDPLAAILGAGLAGLVIGLSQWLALGRAVGAAWAIGTAIAVAAGSAISWLLAGPPVSLVSAGITGAIAGVLVGAAQAWSMRRGRVVAMQWIATVAISWTGGWIITGLVIVDLDRGYPVFGASGALFATVITGVVLRRIMGPRRPGGAAAELSAGHESEAVG